MPTHFDVPVRIVSRVYLLCVCVLASTVILLAFATSFEDFPLTSAVNIHSLGLPETAPIWGAPRNSVMSLLQTHLILARDEVESRKVSASSTSLPTSKQQLLSLPTLCLFGMGSIVLLILLAGCFRSGLARLPGYKGARDSTWIAMFSVLASALDGLIASAVVPVLPQLGDKYGPVFLFFSRPLVGVALAAMVPAMLATTVGATRLQRVGGTVFARTLLVAGLASLAVSCLFFALALAPPPAGSWKTPLSSSLGWISLPGVTAGSLATVFILISALYAPIMVAPSPAACGTKFATVIAARSVGSACGPTLLELLQHNMLLRLGVQTGVLSIAFSWLGVVSAALCVACAALNAPKSAHGFAGAELVVAQAAVGATAAGTHQKALESLKQVFGDFRVCMVLLGVGLTSAILSLNNILLPLFGGAVFDGPVLGGATLVQVMATLAAGLATDLLGKKFAGAAATASLVSAACGLRAAALHSDFPMATSAALRDGSVSSGFSIGSWAVVAGVMFANGGLGMYLGLCLSEIVEVISSCGSANTLFADMDLKHAALAATPQAPVTLTALVICSVLVIALLLGSGVGAAFQWALCPRIGYEATLQVFAAVLVCHCMVLLYGQRSHSAPNASHQRVS